MVPGTHLQILITIIVFFYSGTVPSYLMDFLGLRLVGAVGARINARTSYSQPGPAMVWIRTQVLTVASPARLMTELSRYP